MEEIGFWAKLITSIGAMSPAGWIAMGVATVVIGIGAFFFWRYIKNQAIAKAAKETRAERDRSQTGIAEETAKTEREALTAEEQSRELAKKYQASKKTS